MTLDQYTVSKSHSIEHKTITLPVPWSAFTQAFETKLGRFSASSLRNAKSASDIESIVNEANGSQSFAIFTTTDHGILRSLVDSSSSKARRYEMGNALFASRMTTVDLRAGQYAPLTIFVHEEPGKANLSTTIEFETAESLFGMGTDVNSKVLEVARILDQKRENLFEEILHDLKGSKND
jgi:hypothetical protein